MSELDLSKFHILTVISNPVRYQSRYKLYEMFAEDIQRKGAQLWTIEMQTGARTAAITKYEHAKEVTLWSSALTGEPWVKENLLNVGIQNLSVMAPDWRYVMWVDADVRFEKPMLAEVAQALQHWEIVQCWSHAVDLGPSQEMVGYHVSFMAHYWYPERYPLKGQNKGSAYYGRQGHPGYCWAARRDALNKIGISVGGGPLLDFGILGSSDRHMAGAFVGKAEETVHGGVHPNYKKWLMSYQDRCEKYIKRNVGFIPGTIRHSWHGPKNKRGYDTRWKILDEWQFDPETDIKRDVSGIWTFVIDTPRQQGLRDAIRKYMRSRDEDNTSRNW